ncbi:MAG: hypothetical protein ACBZ72_04590 [Candidatus Bathyarchaeia archaeon]|jgi:hypothetical protein
MPAHSSNEYMREYLRKRRERAKTCKKYTEIFNLEIGVLSDFKKLPVPEQEALRNQFVKNICLIDEKIEEKQVELEKYVKLRADQWQKELLAVVENISKLRTQNQKQKEEKQC